MPTKDFFPAEHTLDRIITLQEAEEVSSLSPEKFLEAASPRQGR